MNPDGTNKTQLGLGLFGTPSRAPHGGHHWFLYSKPIPDSYNPDGSQRMEIFALRDDYQFETNNNSQTKVQLTSDATLQTQSALWLPGDQLISIRARRWSSVDPGASIVDAGIYTAELVFDLDGNVVGLAAQPTAPAISFPVGPNGWPLIGGYSWNPAGDKAVYETSPGLWIADLNGIKTQIYTGDARHAQWSPDGSKIVFTLGRGISTIKPDGKGRKEIIRGTSQWFYGHPHFNATGSHIVCVGGQSGISNNDVFRSDANGGFLTNLTLTPAPAIELPLAWR